jgi:hypothetical protein
VGTLASVCRCLTGQHELLADALADRDRAAGPHTEEQTDAEWFTQLLNARAHGASHAVNTGDSAVMFISRERGTIPVRAVKMAVGDADAPSAG